MRKASFSILFSILFIILLGATAHAQKINPKTQISWPESCTVYDVLAATCFNVQGSDSNLLSSGTVTGSTGTPFCTDANSGATTVGCTPPPVGESLQFAPLAPVTGQYVVVYPSSFALTTGTTNGPFCGGGASGPTGSVVATDSSAYITNGPCGNTVTSNTWGATWSGFSLPSGLTAGQVTSIYAFAVSSYSAVQTAPGNLPGTVAGVALDCDPGGGDVLLKPSGTYWDLQQITATTTYTGSTIGTISCEALLGRSLIIADHNMLNVPAIGLIVYYTGSPLPATTAVDVLPPLYYNAALNELGIDPSTPFPANQIDPYTVATLPGVNITVGSVVLVNDGTTTSDCSTGGGTNPVLCYSNGTAYTAYAGGGSGGITQLTSDVTTPSSSSGSTVATAVNLPGHIALTGTPSAGQIPTATGSSSATWQSPAAAANSPMYELLPNDATTGTGANLLACWTTSGVHQQTVGTCPANSTVNGTDQNPPIVGVCVSGCGTTGYATIQFAGAVSWLCDGTVTTTEYWVKPSGTVAGECDQPSGTFAPSPNENPEGNTVLGRVLVGNAGTGTAATISLLPFGSYGLGNGNATDYGGGTFTNYALFMNGSNFGSMSHDAQAPSTSYIPYAVAANGFYINGSGSDRYSMIGNEGGGVDGIDVSMDTLTNGPGLPRSAMFRFFGSQYQVPFINNSASGTITLGNRNNYFDVPNSTGLYWINLTGNATTYTPCCGDDNQGHILTFVITPNAFTWTWPTGGPPNFINAPIITNSSIPITTEFIYDGTNYQCVLNCAVRPPQLYSAAGTALPTCNSGSNGVQLEVSDATSPTYLGAYTSGGAITAAVICSYNGSAYSWLTH